MKCLCVISITLGKYNKSITCVFVFKAKKEEVLGLISELDDSNLSKVGTFSKST